jgi:hypothetical protein
VNKPPSYPIVLAQLEQWKSEQIDRIVERVRLALAAGNPDRVLRIVADWERSQLESPPIETLLGDHTAAVLRRHQVWTIADLQAAAPQLLRPGTLPEGTRLKVQRALERLA